MPSANIVLLIPISRQMSSETLGDVFRLLFKGIIDHYIFVEGCLLPGARNDLIKKAYECVPNFTHVLFIDDDMINFTPEDLWKLYKADKPIISGICTQKEPPYRIAVNFLNSEPDFEAIGRGEIIEVRGTGAAFTLIQRKVLDDTREDLEKSECGPVWFTLERLPRLTFDNEVNEFVGEAINNYNNANTSQDQFADILLQAITLGLNARNHSVLFGEDLNFCLRAALHGHKSYIHAGVRIGHIGKKIASVVDTFKDLKRRLDNGKKITVDQPVFD